MAKRRRRQSGVTVQEINWPIACQHAAPAAAPPSQPLPDVGGESHAAVWDPAALLPLADLQDLRSRSQVATASGNNNAAREGGLMPNMHMVKRTTISSMHCSTRAAVKRMAGRLCSGIVLSRLCVLTVLLSRALRKGRKY